MWIHPKTIWFLASGNASARHGILSNASALVHKPSKCYLKVATFLIKPDVRQNSYNIEVCCVARTICSIIRTGNYPEILTNTIDSVVLITWGLVAPMFDKHNYFYLVTPMGQIPGLRVIHIS